MITAGNTRRWAAIALAGTVATGFAAVGLGTAAVTMKTLNTTCMTPVGNQALTAKLEVNAPDAATVGQPVNPTVKFTNTVPAAQAKQLANLTGANGMNFTATFHDTWSGAATGDAMGKVAVNGVTLNPNGDTTFTGTITYANPVTPTAAGMLTLTAGNVDSMITPTKDGAATALGTVASPCTVNAGQDAVLFTVKVA